MKKLAITATVALVLCGSAFAGPVTGPGTIDWKGFTWTVDKNATAEVNSDGYLEISVDGDTGDPAADNWNIHTTLTSLFTQDQIDAGVWIEFSFLDTNIADDGQGGYEYGGGPRAYLDTGEDGVEYMFQGGIYDGYDNYYVNHNAHESGVGWVFNSWPYSDGRVEGEHTFKVQIDGGGNAELWFDGNPAGQYDNLSGGYVPSFFQTAYLGVTSNGLEPGSPAFGIYTDFQYGTVATPEPMTLAGAAMLGLGSLFAGRFRRKRA